jgi:prophage tail gpP-like protein
MLGDDLVLTGYIDSITPSIDKDSHFITIGGRGKCQDLVDCSAIWPGGQMTDSDILQVARKLAKPYDISVSSAPGQDRGPFIPTFNITYGDTAYSVIEYMCRYRGMLAYELPDGSLHLSRATSTARHYGGLAEGVNIERAQASYSTSLRFQEISVFSLSTNVYQDTGKLSFLVTKVSDTDVTRYRTLFVVMEATGVDLDLRQKRAEWEKSRRYGRSQRVTLITDAWRDAADILYSINTLIGIEAPSLNIPSQRELLISEISYLRDEKGTHCEMVLMPTEAFSLPPVVIQTWPDVKPL